MLHEEFLRLVDTLPIWERDELRRFLERGTLDDEDDARTIALLKQSRDLDPGIEGLAAAPLAADHLAALAAGPDSYFLAGIQVVGGCNALPAGASLAVNPGLGVHVYAGRNGAGKSSFVRLLRAAGMARAGLDILPDVFASSDTTGSAAVQFDIYVDGELQRVAWRQETGSESALSVAVYDRDCSGVYLESGNVAEYLPHGLDAFAALADARKRIKNALLQEAASLEEHAPTYSDEVEYGTRVQAVSDGWGDTETACDELAQLAEWGPGDDQRLHELQVASKRVKNARQAYAKHVRQIETTRSTARAAEQAQATLADCEKVFAASLREELMAAFESLSAKRGQLEAARARAAQGPAMESLLTGTDSAEWIALLRAAKAFSEAHAYPRRSFPATDEDCVCVLCQQPIGPPATDRLRAFAAALDRASQEGVEADPIVRALRQDVSALEVAWDARMRSLDDGLSRLAQLVKSDALKGLAGTIGQVNDCISAMEKLPAAARAGCFEDIDGDVLQQLLRRAGDTASEAAVDCWGRAADLEAKTAEAPESFEEDELSELRARYWLRSNLRAMQQRVAALRVAGELEDAASGLSITALTTLSKRIAAELVTTQFIGRLRAQLTQVGLGYLQAQVVSSGRAGVTTIRLAPPDKAFKKTDLSRVLSEGEQALMGFAAFLAELEQAGHRGPIVLDDPATGLDAQNTALMADRIAKLATKHQVIVMTHDDDFIADLERASAAHESAFTRRTVSRTDDVVGVVR